MSPPDHDQTDLTQRRLARLRAERDLLERKLKEDAAQLARLRVRNEELTDRHEVDQERVGLLENEAPTLRDGVAAARVSAAGSKEWASERRVLVRHLIQTQRTLDARTDQLAGVLRSRWYRLARSSWQARRRRPPLGALALAAIAVAGLIVTALLASTLAVFVAAVLGAILVGGLAAAYAIVVPARRDKRVPAMTGKGTFADPLPDDVETMRSLLADSAASDDRTSSPAARDKQSGVSARRGGSGTLSFQPEDAKQSVRLVPDLPRGLERSDRDRWLAATRAGGLGELRVAGILDDMSRACFAPECRLNCDFTMHDWRERLEAEPPHLLLVESAWAGNSGGWQYGVASYSHPDYQALAALASLLNWCRELGIPTVFWNKEDPIHFERFKQAAALFDHVFTTDANRISDYEALHSDCVASVQALPFAAQPRLHNPIPVTDARLRAPVFAGTYYRNRHRDRRDALEMILDAARPFGLQIFDRTAGIEGGEYGFPERFLPHIRGRLSYEQIIDVYKRHRVFLNVNSVVDSPTMFSRRVFELLACGTAVLSTESVGIETTFGDLVPIVTSVSDATSELERLLEDDSYYSDLTSRASRLVLAEHTYRARLARIAEVAGFELPTDADRQLAVLALVDEVDEIGVLRDTLAAQSRQPDQILLGVGEQANDRRKLEQLFEQSGRGVVRVVRQQDVARSQRRQELAALASANWVAPIDPGSRLGDDHLRDLTACTTFAQADVLGVAAHPSDANRYVQAVGLDAAIASRALVAGRGWPDDPGAQHKWFEQGVRFFAVAGAWVDADRSALIAPPATARSQTPSASQD